MITAAPREVARVGPPTGLAGKGHSPRHHRPAPSDHAAMLDIGHAPNARVPRNKPRDELHAVVTAFLSQPGALPKVALEQLFARRDIPLRDKPCGACSTRPPRAPTKLDVEDLDIPNRRAVIRRTNGELDYLH